MAEAAAHSFTLKEFKQETNNTIDKSWRTEIEADSKWSEELDSVLDKVYEKYQPLPNGQWSASPKWTEMFRWSTVPFRDVRAILILMEPLPPSREYRSTGMALGLEQIPSELEETPKIEQVATVWKFFHLLHCWKYGQWTEDDQRPLRDTYQAGFDPMPLSKKSGVLFLNVSLTRGGDSVGDVQSWWPFTKLLLDALSKSVDSAGSHISVIQLYNNSKLQSYFNDEELNFCVLKARFMSRRLSGPECTERRQPEIFHIAYFKEVHINEYSDEIKKSEYKQHQDVLETILTEIKSGALAIRRRSLMPKEEVP